MNSDHNVIEVHSVSKYFKETTALHDVTVRFESGKIYGIIGHNGSGKTVLFKLICGFLKCSKGEIRVNGKVIGKDQDMLSDAGIIIEEPAFLGKWNAYRNLDFLYCIRNRNNANHIYSIIQKVGLNPKEKKPVEKYSLGMKQRLAIAQAIMENPPILILDEPMNGLDKQGIDEMRQIFLEMKESGKLILLASHNREDIDKLCDEVYLMENGSLSRIK